MDYSIKRLLRQYGIFYDEKDLEENIEVGVFDNIETKTISVQFDKIHTEDISFKFNSFKYSYMINYLCIIIDQNTYKPIKFIIFTENNKYEGCSFELEERHLPLNIRKYESNGTIGLHLITSFNGSYAEEDIKDD